MKKIIIGIHGLGNKPPAKLLRKWWRSSIEEGLEYISRPHPFIKFEMVFWADLLYPQLENPNLLDPENPLFISEPYYHSTKSSTYLPDFTKIKHHKFISDQLDKLFSESAGKPLFSSLSEYLIRHNFRDLDLYFSDKKYKNTDKTIREMIQTRLTSAIEKHQKRKILLIAHSMGSIIALDVLSRHKELKVDTLITIGSPLGLAAIRNKIISPAENSGKTLIPETITRNWFNLADLNDKVALDFDLNDDFYAPSNRISIQDYQVYNDYTYNGTRNPHKAFGYLRTRKTAEIINNFLMEGKSEYFHKFIIHFNRLIQTYKKKQLSS
jgi:hypothetical protein